MARNALEGLIEQFREALTAEHEELTEELVRQLHARLKPYFLRRVKADVLDLPPKVTTKAQ